MNIILDGHSFTLKSDTGVLRTPLVEWPVNTRLDGQQKRKDRSLLSSYVIDDWSGGLGVERQNVENANHATRLWDAENVDTRFPSQIVLSPAFNFCTIVPSRGDLKLPLQHIDQLYFIETERTRYHADTGITYGLATAYRFTAPNIIGSHYNLAQIGYFVGTPGTASVGSVSGLSTIGANIAAIGCVVHGGQRANRLFVIGTLGGAVQDLTAALSLSGENFVKFAPMSNLGGTGHIIAYEDINKVKFWLTNTSWGSVTLKSTVDTVIGSYLAPLVNDGLAMYADLPEGVYDFDAAPTIVVSATGMRDKNPQQVMFKNELYFKNEYSLIHYDGVNLTGVGYDLEDGLPSDKMGEITAMTSNYKWIYAAVKGATYSHILTRDQGGAWQYYARIPSAGLWVREMFLSNSPDAIDRLWCLFDNYAYPGYFLNPVVNPLVAGTYSFEATGYFTKPIFDGGLPEVKGAYYDFAWLVDSIGSAVLKNKVNLLYGLDGASPLTLLGITATNNSSFLFGSPYGVSANRIQSCISFTRDTIATGTTPVFRDAIIHYLKDPDKRESFDFNIDVKETARNVGLPQEAVLATLSRIMDIKTLLPFHYGLVATRQVKVLDIPAQEDIENDSIMGGERSAFVRLRVAEIL